MLISILSAPFILPVIVAISGVLFIFGREGFFNQSSARLAKKPCLFMDFLVSLLVHVFFNLPLAIRILLFGWGAIPIEHHRVARGLNLNAWARFKIIELPMLVSRVPAATAIIFVICLSSFAVALLLGADHARQQLNWQFIRHFGSILILPRQGNSLWFRRVSPLLQSLSVWQ